MSAAGPGGATALRSPLLGSARPGYVARVFGSNHRALTTASAVLVLITVISLTAPLWWHQLPDTTNPLGALRAPSWGHPMGTDDVGRDVLARFLEGARISIGAGVVTAVVAGALGALFGVAAALGPGLTDNVIMRVVDALLAFPPLILAIAVTAGVGPGVVTACIGIGISVVPYVIRIVRSDALRIAASGHIEASRALGVPPRQLVTRHLLPYITPGLLVQTATAFSFTIISLAGLGFIGLGAQVPTPEWGAMITEGSSPLVAGQWWISVFPGAGLLIVTAAALIIADQIRILLDPGRSVAEILL